MGWTILGIFVISGLVGFAWVNGIDYMKKKYPDYKGEDFLNEKENEHNIY